MNRHEQIRQVARCYRSPTYFCQFIQIYDATAGEWIPFTLWPAQETTLATLLNNRLTIILKARQLGLTWLCLAYILWLMLFRPQATALLFSRRDDEAVHLLWRLREMYKRLPDWLKIGLTANPDNDHEWRLSNGSEARAFPTTAGDSYTASVAFVDEADLTPDLGRLMAAVKPTIDGGGQMILLSRADKSKPESLFKQIYRAAKAGLNEWQFVFLPWDVRPERDAAWYAAQKRDALANTGTLDDLHEQYPKTDAEALTPRTLDKRFAPQWLIDCYEEQEPLDAPDAPAIPGLRIYQLPRRGAQYVMGLDPAEGNPTSDDSALAVLDKETGAEVASLAGKFQPSTLAAHADSIGRYFNNAALMVERNNHGHAVLLWLRDNSRLIRLNGHDGREGWLSSTRGKTLMYDATADAYRNGERTLRTFETFTQLSGIEGATLRAPDGQNDDRADADALATVAALRRTGRVKLPQTLTYASY